MASVNARFWIHPPLFQMRPAMVGATSSAIPQYQEGVAEVPEVVGDDEDPRHVGPQHVLALLGNVDAEPAGHAQDVEQTRTSVEHVEDAAVKQDALVGDEARIPGDDGALEVASHSNQDVDGHDHEREHLEPVGTSHLRPAVFEHHEADAASRRRVHFRVVEPSTHGCVRGVVERPFGAHGGTDLDSDAIDGHRAAYAEEEENSSGLPAASHLVEQDECNEHHEKS